MLNNVSSMFDNMVPMLKKIKKKNYEERTKTFRDNYGHYIDEMTGYVDASEDKDATVEKIAQVFIEDIKAKYEVKGKINGRVQADMNFFMIYFVFPAILLTENENATKLADGICAKWGASFKNSNIGYTTYDKLYSSFKEKIFGIF